MKQLFEINHMKSKKFIAPGGWFEMTYPASFQEDEDSQEAFLFYDPASWSGNFRISAYRGPDPGYAQACLREELQSARGAVKVMVGPYECAYQRHDYKEDGMEYADHSWVMGKGDLAFYVSFACERKASNQVALDIISSLTPRDPGKKYPPETIPVRLLEIQEIDEGYDRIQRAVKQRFTKDFRGEEEDVALLDRLVKEGGLSTSKRDVWVDLGITLLAIICNQYEGYEWQTLVDQDREAPVLLETFSGKIWDPKTLVWDRVQKGQTPDMQLLLQEILESA